MAHDAYHILLLQKNESKLFWDVRLNASAGAFVFVLYIICLLLLTK